MSSRRTPRPSRLLAGVTAVALAATGLVAGSIAIAPAAQAAPPATLNPFSLSGGFTVYARENALLQNQETEGSIAVGGTATVQGSSGTYSIIHVSAGTADYTLPIVDGDPTRFLTGEYATASTGILAITSAGTSDPTLQGDLKLVDRTGPFRPFARADWIRLNTNPSNVDQTPLIDATHQQYPASATPPSGSTGGGSIYTANTGATAVADYVEANRDASWDDTDSCLADLPTTGVPVTINTSASAPPDRVVLNPLSADQANVLDYSTLPSGTKLLQFSAGPTPGVANPLVIRVPAGTTAVNGLTIDPQGQYSPYLLWDLSEVTGPVTVTAPNGGSTRMDGSIYAPNADLTVDASPLDGQIVGQNVTVRGGEVHSFLFAGQIACDAPADPGTFQVQKALQGISAGDLPAGTVFTVDYEATLPDGTTEVGSLDLPADGTVVPAGIDFPPGTVVTFSEIAPPTVPGWAWGTPTIADNPITIASGSTATVTVTNTATDQLGEVTVQKTVVDQNGGSLPFVPAPVEMTWTADDGQQGTVTVPADGTPTTVPAQFPLGTTVSFTEDFVPPAGYDWTDATWTPSSSVVVSDATQATAVGVTNELTPSSGRVIRVVKTVAGVDERAYDFSITYNTTAPDGDRVDRPLEVGVPQTLDDVAADVETLYLTENLPQPDDGSVWQDPVIRVTTTAGIQDFVAPFGTEVPIDISGGGDIAIEIMNELVSGPQGTFTLQKAFASDTVIDGGPLRPTFGFYAEWTATTPTGEVSGGTLRLPAAGTPVSPLDAGGAPLQFPYGTTVSFTEVSTPNVPGIDWGTPTYAPANQTLTIGDGGAGTVTGTVTNSATWRTGTFQVRKDLEGIDPALLPLGTTFTIDYTGRTPLGTAISGWFELPADGTPAGPADRFPVGSLIQLSERAPDAGTLPPGYEWAGTTWSPRSSIVIRSSTTTPELTVTNSVEHLTRYTVLKTVDGTATGAVPTGTTYPLNWWLDYEPQTPVALTANVPVTSPYFPVGSIVEVQEGALPVIAGVDWGSPTWTADGVTLTPQANGRVVLPAASVDGLGTVAIGLANHAATTPLPNTGGTRSPAVTYGGLAALLLGVALVLRRRRVTKS